MSGARPLHFLLLATIITATACDRGPTEPISRLAPLASSFTLLGGSLSFTESFSGNCNSSGKLEMTGPGNVTCSSGAAVFNAVNDEDGDRTYLRTTAANYQTTDVVAEVTVTVHDEHGPNGIAYIGFGRGEPNCNFFCEPATDPAIYLRVRPNSFYPGSEITTAISGIQELGTISAGATGTHRVRMTWNHTTRQLTFDIDANYIAGDPFVADATLGPITVPAGVFDNTNSRIFVGGAGDATFDDLAVVTYPLHYDFTGFFAPIANNDVLNAAKAGGAIPVQFSLGSDEGLGIMAAGYPTSAQISCTTAPQSPVEEQTVTPGSSSLSYDATSNRYNYVWKTDKSWAGQCRQLTVKLIDGTEHTAKFSFTK